MVQDSEGSKNLIYVMNNSCTKINLAIGQYMHVATFESAHLVHGPAKVFIAN